MMKKKIYFDAQGCVGTVIGNNIMPILENEKMVCEEPEAVALGLRAEQWIRLEDIKNLPNTHADTAYRILSE